MKLTSCAVLTAVLALSAVPVRANYSYQENLRIVQLAGVLANQASWIANQATFHVGPGADWYDWQALNELRGYAQYTRTLSYRAQQILSNPPPLSNGPGHGAGSTAGQGPSTPPDRSRDRGYLDMIVHRQLEQLFYHLWNQATRVEAALYRSYRLRALHGFWNFQIGGTLRQLRWALYSRDGRQARCEEQFEQMYN